MEYEILNELRESAGEDLAFYSNRGKEKRELWVVEEFLKISEIIFDTEEIQSLEQNNKTDVIFRDAMFQVKEIVNPDIKRSSFYKGQYNSFMKATTLEDIKFPEIVEDLPPVARMYDLIISETIKLGSSEKYKDFKCNLDLIFYVSRSRASILNTNELNIHDFSDLGWRSVSCVNSKQAAVLYSSKKSPKFLENLCQRVIACRG